MVCINLIVITAYLLLKARAYTMIDRFDCSSYLNKTANHNDICFMLTKCKEHMNRYQTDFANAKQYISCCQTFSQLQPELHCQLDCGIKCEEANCIYEKATCKCHDGYVYSETEQRCVPKCPSTCSTNKCTAPNVCECPPGYKLGDSGDHCLPECSEMCENNNGYCPTPNRCKCLPGYKSATNDPSKCVPECLDSCTSSSGTCHLPNICECPSDHYFNKTTKRCQPDCSKSCLSTGGTCEKAGVCTCPDGHIYDKTADTCTPDCASYCTNGKCTPTNICKCDDGYEFNASLRKCEPKCNNGYYYSKRLQTCKPKCDITCKNGFCIGPNQCKCRKGYTYDAKTGECNRKCPEHYQLVDDKCQAPTCDTPCTNGICVAENQCECLNGYTLVSTGVCELLLNCSTNIQCNNGWCASNNTCICNDGFVLDQNDEMTCVPLNHQNVPLLRIIQNSSTFMIASPIVIAYKFPWIIIFCTAALITTVLLVGAETWVHRACNRTLKDENEVEYKWLDNNLFIPNERVVS